MKQKLSPPPQPMTRASKTFAVLLGFAAILIGGTAHGVLSQRWGPGGELHEAAKALESFPKEMGEWRLESAEPLEKNVESILRCEGYVNHTYRNASTGEAVRVAVIVGPPGPIAVHTPEICFSSQSYLIDQPAEKVEISSSSRNGSFWRVGFRSKAPGGERLLVYYGWSEGGAWKASSSPRFQFGGYPYLYKIQLSGTPRSTGSGEASDPCRKFLQDCLASDWAPRAAR